MEKRKAMPEVAKGLIPYEGADDGEGDDTEGEIAESHDMHPGEVASMQDFSDAHAAGDHEGMARALGHFHEIHTKKSPKKGRDPKTDEGQD